MFWSSLLGILCGFAIAYYFNKAKAGLHPDYMLHLTYWVANSPKLKELPESNNRHFFG
ncbi:type IV conjugative transfer system protein TraL [Acinetobacter baumannii]|uniref:type IV conjugative transfer system protein TraL n=1 Tax=Acinetobacter baumannii TaxID=470 RepID=UPI001D18EE77|nr:type IV conjugative transfer system protein TraL [Acinetobacter baumannii]